MVVLGAVFAGSFVGGGSCDAHAASRSGIAKCMCSFIGNLRTVGGGLRRGEQLGVEAVVGDELGVVALLDDLALLHDDDEVAIADGRKPVRDRDARAAQ